MSIYVVTHKKYNIPEMEGYVPIQVGAALGSDLGYLKDSDGDNISSKNKNYCELTALYYVWKNRLDDDIVGLVHYRRYFYSKKTLNLKKDILTYKQIRNILKEYDVIVPYKMRRAGKTVKDDYSIHHNIHDYDECRNIISEQCPEFLQSFDNVSSSKELYQYNMMVCSKELFNNYCEWLFNILFELENRVDISDYDAYNQRIYGFLSERLLNVWIEHKNLKVKKLEVYNIESDKISLLKSNIKNTIKPIMGVKR
ncbi:MAG: DUF4422 domain-containing protein [Oscillospiraceae bacterium]|nr:DUF4422 domain-containing protein [Oscillospiraceae bacterium]